MIFILGFINGDEKPNILLIMTDDLGWADVSWNNDNVKTTPNLLKLAQFWL